MCREISGVLWGCLLCALLTDSATGRDSVEFASGIRSKPAKGTRMHFMADTDLGKCRINQSGIDRLEFRFNLEHVLRRH
jgi:hypothetical protein